MSPPSGMAWSALMTRFCITWLNCPTSTIDRPELVLEVKAAPDIGAAQDKTGRVPDDLFDRGDPPHRRAALAEGEELLGQLLRAHGGLFRVFQYLAGDGRFPGDQLRQVDVPHDRGEDIVEIVGDAARQYSDRFELFYLEELVVELDLLR